MRTGSNPVLSANNNASHHAYQVRTTTLKRGVLWMQQPQTACIVFTPRKNGEFFKTTTMKTVADVKQEMQKHQEIIDVARLSAMSPDQFKEVKYALERMEFLKEVYLYMQSNPTEEFITRQRDEIVDRINRRMLEFNPPRNAVQKIVRKMKVEHEKKYEIPKLRNQLMALEYILTDPAKPRQQVNYDTL